MQMKNHRRVDATLLTLLLATTLSACTSVPEQPTTERVPLPAQWSRAVPQTEGDVVSQNWWRSFGSTELDALIAQAHVQSLDVATSLARVNQARARADQAGAALLPSLTGTAGVNRQASLDGGGGSASATGTRFSAGLAASYEVDFWGKNQSVQNSALAGWQASVFDADTVRLTVTAQVANAWLLSVALRERMGIAELNIKSAERLLAFVSARVRAGAASPLELAQQRGLLAGQQRQLVQLQQQAEEAQTRIALLLGQTRRASPSEVSFANLRMPQWSVGVPSELMTRRPDIARAEALLAAANADVHAARAAMLPSLVLGGEVGSSGDRWRRIFDNPLYSLAAGLAAPIFDGGRLAAGRDLALAQREEVVIVYRQSIVQAFADVQFALDDLSGLQAQAESQADELVQAQTALRLAESRYRAGAETLLTLIDAQRTLYAVQDAAAQLHLARLQASVALYRAFGGGWNSES